MLYVRISRERMFSLLAIFVACSCVNKLNWGLYGLLFLSLSPATLFVGLRLNDTTLCDRCDFFYKFLDSRRKHRSSNILVFIKHKKQATVQRYYYVNKNVARGGPHSLHRRQHPANGYLSCCFSAIDKPCFPWGVTRPASS